MNRLDQCLSVDACTQLLCERGVRPTPRRVAILNAVRSTSEWQSVEAIFSRLHTAEFHIGTSTIARVLGDLVQTGLLARRIEGRRFWFRPLENPPPGRRLLLVVGQQEMEITDRDLSHALIATVITAGGETPQQEMAKCMRVPAWLVLEDPIAPSALSLNTAGLQPISRAHF